jgi:hypothetical protein
MRVARPKGGFDEVVEIQLDCRVNRSVFVRMSVKP